MHRALAAIITCSILLSASAAVGQTRAEKLQYDVTWGEADVAELKLQRGCPTTKGYVPAALTAKSVGFADQIHEFSVRLDSFTDTKGRTMEGRTYVREDGEPRSFKTRFATGGDAVVQKTFKTRRNVLELSFRGATHDLLSWLYQLRTEELKQGKHFDYFVWDGWKLVRLRAKVGKRERIWTPAGTFSAFKIAVVRTRLHHRGDEAYQPKDDPDLLGTIWLSANGGHLPVAMDFDAPVGVARIRLAHTRVVPCK